MNWRLALLVAVIAAPGPVATSWLALPLLVDPNGLEVPLRTLQIATAVQGLVLAVVTSVVGTLLAAKVGLRAPVLNSLVSHGDALAAFRSQWLPGVIGGVIGTAVIIAFYSFSPDALATIQARGNIPLAARLLYGGVTEEVMVRWGLMSFLVWAAWRVAQRGGGEVSGGIVWFAIVISSLLFGLSHVPSVAAALGSVPAFVVVYITLGNAAFGMVAGFLFWRYGLESAISAHLLAHVLAFAIRG